MNFNSNKKGKHVPEDLLSRLPALSKRISKERMNDDSSKTPTNAVAPPISIAQSHSDKDFNFTMKLSQNLIVQTRKLQSENKKKDIKIVDLNKKIVQLTSSVSNLQSKVTELSSAEQQLDETNWELNLNYQENLSNLNKTKDINSKLSKDLASITYTNNELSQEVEELRIKLKNIDDTYSTHKSTTEARIHELESQVDELNTENNDLSNKISGLQDELKSPSSKDFKSPRASMTTGSFKFFNSSKFDPSNPDFPLDSESKNIDSKISQVAGIPINNIHLESQTLKSNLDHAHYVIAKLRGQLLKYRKEDFGGSLSFTDSKQKDGRFENDESDRRIKELKHGSHGSRSKKSKKSADELKSKNLISNTRKSTTIKFIDHETDQLLKDTENWLDYESESSSNSDSEIDEGIEIESNDFDNFGIDGSEDAIDSPTVNSREPVLTAAENISTVREYEEEKDFVDRYIKKHNLKLVPAIIGIDSNSNMDKNSINEFEIIDKNLNDEILEIDDISDEDMPHANLSSELKFATDDLSHSPIESLSKKFGEHTTDKEELNALLDSMCLVAIDINDFKNKQIKLDKLQSENNLLVDEVSDLREKLVSIQSENEKHLNNSEGTQKELQTFKDKFSVADLLVDELSSEIRLLKSSKSQSEAEVASLTKVIATLKLEVQDLTYKIDDLKFKNNSTEKAFNDLSVEHSTLKSNYNLMKTDLEKSKISERELQTKHEDISSNHVELTKANQKLTLEFSDAIKELDTLNSQHLDLKNSNIAVISDLKAKQSVINEINDLLKSKIKIISTKEKEIFALQDKFADAETKINEFETKLENSENCKELTKAELEKLNEAHEKLKESLRALKATSEENMSSKQALENELVEIKRIHESNLSVLHDRISDFESKCDGLKTAVVKETTKVKELTDLLCERETELTKYAEADKASKEKVSSLEKEISESKISVDTLTESLDGLKSLNEDLESKIRVLQSEYSLTNSELVSLKNIHDDMKSKYTSGSTKLLELEAAHSALKEKNIESQESILNLEAENKTIKDSHSSAIRKLELKHKSLESKIAELTDELSASSNHQEKLILAHENSKNEIENHIKSKKELTEKIAKLIESENSKSLDLESSVSSYHSLNESHNENLAKHKELQLLHDNKCKIWSSRINELENKFKESTAKNHQLTEASQELQNKFDAKSNELILIKSKLQELETAVANKSSKISELEKSLEEAVNHADIARTEKGSLQKSYETLEVKMMEQNKNLGFKLMESEAGSKELLEAKTFLEKELQKFKALHDSLESKHSLMLKETDSNTMNLKSEIDCLKMSNTELEQKLESKIDEIKAFNNRVATLVEENASLKSNITDLIEKNKAVYDDLDNKKSKLENHIEDNKKLSEEVDRVKLEIMQFKDANRKLTNESQNRQLEIDEHIKRNIELDSSLKKNKDQLKEQIEHHKSLKTDLKENQYSLESKISENDALIFKNVHLEKELEEAGLRHQALVDELEVCKKDLDKNLAKHEDLAISMKEVQSKLDASIDTTANITKKYDATSKELSQFILKFETLQSENAKTKENHALSNSALESLKTDHSVLQAEREHLDQEKKLISAEIIALKNSNDAVKYKLNQTILDLSSKLESEIESKDSVSELHKGVTANLMKTAAELQNKKTESKLLRDENDILQRKVKDFEQRHVTLNKSIASVQADHNDLSLKNAKLFDDHKLLQKTCADLEKRLLDSTTSETNLNHKIREMEYLISELRENVSHFTEEHELNEQKVKDLEKLKSETGNTVEIISKKLVDLEASHSLLLNDQERIEKQRAGLKEEYQSTLLKHEKLEKDHTNLVLKHSKLTDIHDNLNKLTSSKTKQIEDLSTKLINSESRCSVLNAEHIALNESHAHLEIELKSQTEEYEKLKCLLADKEIDSAEKDTSINMLKQRIEDLQLDIKKHLSIIELKEKSIESLEEESSESILALDRSRVSHEEAIKYKDAKISKLKAQEKELSDKFDAKVKEYAELYELHESQTKNLDQVSSNLNLLNGKHESVLKLNEEHLSNIKSISIQNTTLQSKLSDKTNEFENLSSIHADKKKEFDSVTESYENTVASLKNTTDDLRNIQNRLESLQTKLESTKSELECKDVLLIAALERSKELEASIKMKNSEVETLNRSIDSINQDLNELKNTHSGVVSSHASLKDELTSRSKELSFINEKHELLSKVNTSLSEELSKIKNDSECLSRQLEDNSAGLVDLKDTKAKLEERLQSIQEEYGNSKKTVEDYKTQITQAEQQLKIKDGLIAEFENKIDSYVSDIHKLNQTINAHAKEISSYEDRHEELSKQLIEKDEILNISKIDLDKLKSSAAQSEKAVVNKDLLLTQAHSEIEKFKKMLNQKEVEHENLVTEQNTLKNEIKEKQVCSEKEIAGLTSELAEIRISNKTLVEELSVLNNENNVNKQQYLDSLDDAKQLNLKIFALNENIDDLSSRLSAFSKKNDALKTEVVILTEGKVKVETALSSANEDILSMKNLIEDLKNENKKIKTSESSLTTNLLEITASLGALKSAHTNLAFKHDSLKESQKASAEKDLETAKNAKELEATISSLNVKHSSAENLVSTLRIENETLRKEKISLESNIKENEEKYTKCNCEKELIMSSLQKLKEKNDLDQKSLEELKKQLNEFTTSNKLLKSQCEKCNSEIDALIKDKADLDNECKNLHSVLSSERIDFSEKLGSLQSTIEELKSLAADNESKHNSVNENYLTATKKIEDLSSTITSLEFENRKLTEEHQSAANKHVSLEKEFEKLSIDKREFDGLTEKFKTISSENEELLHDLKQIQEDYNELKLTHELKNTEAKSMNMEFESKVNSLRLQNSKVQTDFEKIFADYNSLFTDHSKLNASFKELNVKYAEATTAAEELKKNLEVSSNKESILIAEKTHLDKQLSERSVVLETLQAKHSDLSKECHQHIKSLEDSNQKIDKLSKPSNEEFTVDELKQKARVLNFTLVPNDEYAILSAKDQVSKDSLADIAKDMNLLVVPETAYIATNMFKTPDVDNVVVLPKTYYNKLSKNDSLALYKVGMEKIKNEVRKRGFSLVRLDNQQSHFTDISENDEASFSNEGIDSRAYKSEMRDSIRSINGPTRIDYDSKLVSSNTYPIDISKRPSSSQITNRSIVSNRNSLTDASIAMISLATEASLNEPSIIAAVAQTVIGEFLHKYYRRLGPLSVISDTRHERYFWVHPYTMTLYWSTENPVQGNPSEDKTRAAALVGVESVDDNNPLPTGLYHKSIIVHTNDKDVKITCPSRIRHNIWYNSLKYLIHRNAEGLDFS